MLNNGKLFLQLLSSFWLSMYKDDALQIEASLQAQNESIKNTYFNFLQRQLPPNLQEYPIFREDFWHTFEFTEEAAFYVNESLATVDASEASYIAWNLPDAYAEIPYLYNLIFEPSIVLVGGSQSYISEPVYPGELILNREYFNEYDVAITHEGVSVPPLKSFFASTATFTIPPLATGKVTFAKDYFITRFTDTNPPGDSEVAMTSVIYFRKTKNPLNVEGIETKINGLNKKRVTLFAPKVFVDTLELWQMFGTAVGVFAKSSFEYRNFLKGLFYLYTNGPTVTALNVGLNVSYGYPVSLAKEILLKIRVEADKYILSSNLKNEYIIKTTQVSYYDEDLNLIEYRGPILRLNNQPVFNSVLQADFINGDFTDTSVTPAGIEYDIFWEVERFDGLVEDLRIVDYKTYPKWWLDPNIQKTLYPDFAPDLTADQRRDPELIDYLFEKYLKYNTFGVIINFKNIESFEDFKDFFRILQETKPTYKTYVISDLSLNITDDQGDPTSDNPEDDNYYENVPVSRQLSSDEVEIFTFMIVQTQFSNFELLLGMDMIGMGTNDIDTLDNPLIGVALEEIDSFYDMVQFLITFESGVDEDGIPLPGSIVSSYDLGPSYETDVGAWYDGEPIYLGLTANEGLIESVTFITYVIPPTITGATEITETSARLNWLAFPEVDYYEVQYSYDVNFISGVTTDTTTDIYLDISGFNEADVAYYRVRTILDDGNISLYSDPLPIYFSDFVLLWEQSEGEGVELQDSSNTPASNGYIEPSASSDFMMINFLAEGSGIIVDDLTVNDNDGTIETAPEDSLLADYTYLWEQDEGSGAVLEDSGLNDNDGDIETSVAPDPLLDYTYLWEQGEGSGDVLEDSGLNDNDGDIEVNLYPSVPDNLVTTTITSTGFTASWDLVAGALSYDISINEGIPITVFTNTYDATGLPSGVTNLWKVRATNLAGSSDYTGIVLVLLKPAAPTNLDSSVTNTTAELSFDAVTGADTYKIYIKDAGVPILGYNGKVILSNAESVIGLSENTAYTWQVKATNGSGDSDFSSEVSFTTLELNTIFVSNKDTRSYVYLKDTVGTETRLTTQTSFAETWARCKPNGSKTVITRSDGTRDLMILVDNATRSETPIVTNATKDHKHPSWHPTDNKIIYSRVQDSGGTNYYCYEYNFDTNTETLLFSYSAGNNIYSPEYCGIYYVYVRKAGLWTSGSDTSVVERRTISSGVVLSLFSDNGPIGTGSTSLISVYDNNTKVLSTRYSGASFRIHRCNIDGTDLTAITNASFNSFLPVMNETENKLYYQRQSSASYPPSGDFAAYKSNLDGSSPVAVVDNSGNLNEYVTSFGYF